MIWTFFARHDVIGTTQMPRLQRGNSNAFRARGRIALSGVARRSHGIGRDDRISVSYENGGQVGEDGP